MMCTKDSALGMEQPRVPPEFLIMSSAYSKLMEGVWGGLRHPFQLGRTKSKHANSANIQIVALQLRL